MASWFTLERGLGIAPTVGGRQDLFLWFVGEYFAQGNSPLVIANKKKLGALAFFV